jgi:hypothetical protein
MSTTGSLLLSFVVLGLSLDQVSCITCDPQCNPPNQCLVTNTCGGRCNAGYGLNSTTSTCVPCNSPRSCIGSCDTYGPGSCDGPCIAGYSVKNFTCIVCAAHCTSCSQNGKYHCDLGKCAVGFAIDPAYNICAPCDSNCNSTCTKPGLCTSGGCKVGYVSKNVSATDYICAPCDLNCNGSCNKLGAGTCDGPCQTGFSLNSTSGRCIVCGQHCVGGCTVEGAGFCDGPCASGYVKAPTPNNSPKHACYPCATHCTSGCTTEGKYCCDSPGTCDTGLWIVNPTNSSCHICS